MQFLAGGAIFYILIAAFSSEIEESEEGLIVVDEPALLLYLQYQDKAFDEAQAQRLLAGLDGDARARLEQEYVRDEIMVREAFKLGLDANDDVIRQRLIQKMDFILQGIARAINITEDDITAHFNANAGTYEAPAEATFTHIFFSARDRGEEAATAEATKLLPELNRDAVPFENAGRYGDRFYFLRNYVERSERMISDHFGEAMTETLFATAPSETWAGPFISEYGAHLVLLRSVKPARTPNLAEVKDDVVADITRERQAAALRAGYEDLRKNYRVTGLSEGAQ